MDMTLILIAGAALAVIVLIVGLIVSLTSDRSLVEERLGRYVEQEIQVQQPGRSGSSAVMTDWLNRRVSGSSFGETLGRDLARADIKLKAGEFVAIIILLIASFGGLGYFFLGGIPGALMGAALGVFAPRLYIKRQQGRRLVRFNEQLGDMLNLMVNGLRAGYSTMQAMEAVAKELPPPISDEFRRVVQEMQLGITMEAALDNLLRRIPSLDLDLVITAMNVQREVGGNLAEILSTISHTIRERVRVKGEIRVLTSQQVYSGRMLAIMPIVLLLAMYLLNREYVELFWTGDTKIIGYIALGAAAVLIMAGYFTMNKISQIEV
jgi:tight adherence protein B